MMILLVIFCLINGIIRQSKSYEIPFVNAKEFLTSKVSLRSRYEESRETTEAKRESCLDEYRQQKTFYQRRRSLSSFCTQYCTETMDCEDNHEPSACLNNPLWSSRTIKYAQKFERTCYIRISEVLRYEQAEQLCHQYGLQLAVIDNIRLLERLTQLNMLNTTCRGQCPRAKGYYIGLKRLLDSGNSSTWIWSNNVTWIHNETECDAHSRTLYTNANLLCYMGNDGEKKVTVWNKDEPNNHRNSFYSIGEQCVEIIAYIDRKSSLEQMGKLNDIPCNKPALGVICQMKDIKPRNFTRFEYFSTIIGFNDTELLKNDFLSNFGGSIPVNLDAMTAMTEALEGLLTLPSFTTEQATNVFNIVDQLVNVTGQIEVEDTALKLVTNKLLHFLDLFPMKIRMNDERNISLEYENMNMSIVDLHLDREMNEWWRIKDETNSNTIIEINLRILQKLLIESNHYRIIEMIFSNFNLFPQTNTTHFSVPISYQIANLSSIQTNDDLLRYQIRLPASLQSRNMSCVYWSFDANNGSWITDHTCRFTGYKNDYAQCYCNHLTHFALLMLFEPEQTLESLSTIEEFFLTFVTYIGVCLSIFGLIITLITYALFRRSHRNNLHSSLIMLCLAILFVNCLYIPFNLTQSNTKRLIFCTIIAYFFHYFFLASFMWMLIMAVVQYLHFVRIFNTHISHFFIKACVIGWILPLIFPSLVVFFGSNGGYQGESRCWISNPILLYLTFLIPISMIVIFNLIIFGLIMQSIFHPNTVVVSSQRNHSKLQMGAALCCFVSIGCTWFFGLVVLLEPTFLHQFIFCICNSFQGFFIFLFHVYLCKPKREFWRIFCLQHGSIKHSQTSSIVTISKSNLGMKSSNNDSQVRRSMHH